MKDSYDVVIHIGLMHTGSTFLQDKIFPKLTNINYVDRYFFFENLKPDVINLISNEVISWKFSEVVIRRIKKLFPNAHIICVKRDIKGWTKSAYKHYVEDVGKPLLSFDKWEKKFFNDEINPNNYYKLINDLFDEVLYLDFKLLKNDPKMFVSKICDFIGVDMPDFDSSIVNSSLSSNALKYIKWVKKQKIPMIIKRNFLSLMKLIN